jgi:hypothetical protein
LEESVAANLDIAGADAIHAQIVQLRRAANQPALCIEIVMCGDDSAAEWNALVTWLGFDIVAGNSRSPESSILREAYGLRLRLLFSQVTRLPLRNLGDPFAGILILFPGNREYSPNGTISAISEGRILISPISMASNHGGEYASIHQLWRPIVPGSRFSDYLDEMQLADNIAIFWDYSVSMAVQSLSASFLAIVANELEGTRGYRTVVQKQQSKLQTRSITAQYGPAGTWILLQRLQQLESQSMVRYDDLRLAPGGLEDTLEAQLSAIHDLGSEKTPKGKTVSLRPDLVSQVLNSLCGKLRLFFGAEIAFISVVTENVLREVEASRPASAVEPQGPQRVAPISEEQVESVLRSNVIVRRRFQGEIPNMGVLQTFFEARKPLLVLLAFLGILGMTKIRNSPYMVPMSILLVGIGGLFAFNSKVQMQKHLFLKHLAEARGLFRSEMARAISDVQSEWRQLVSQQVTARKDALQRYIDGTNRQLQAREEEELIGQRSRLQNQGAAFESRERRFAALSSSLSAALSEAKRLCSDSSIQAARRLEQK